ncbi:MAG: hypothetical protein AUK49_02080 [Betaproteobacteria bacterium CG2_30_68_42]|nr:MAG: hypothetical protein AUK49_02080 [Betaproteobacteria bacterium CG2_30_68_42]
MRFSWSRLAAHSGAGLALWLAAMALLVAQGDWSGARQDRACPEGGRAVAQETHLQSALRQALDGIPTPNAGEPSACWRRIWPGSATPEEALRYAGAGAALVALHCHQWAKMLFPHSYRISE